jgi:hypothetical protein
MAAADEDGSREEIIRAAVRTISHGTQEIQATFSQARGTLSKAVIRDLHRRVKDLRQTAESAEDAFRDWTVDLSGRPYEKEAKQRYDELRASFEVEVASIQRSMQRVADEVKRRQASKAGPLSSDAGQAAEPEEPSTPTSPPPEPPHAAHRPPVAPSVSVPSASSTPKLPRKQLGSEARVYSHASMASCLEEIASQEERSRKYASETVNVISQGCKLDDGAVPLRDRLRSMPPFMKYIIWASFISLTYMIWSEARYLMSNIAHEEALRGARAGSFGVIPPHLRQSR